MMTSKTDSPQFEPTSVLDPHLTSSPAAADPLLLLFDTRSGLPPPSWEDVVDPSALSDGDDDWDPVSWFLGSSGGGGGEKDDSLPCPTLTGRPPSLPPFPFSDAFGVIPGPADLDGPFPDPPGAAVLPPLPDGPAAAFNQAHLDQLIRAAQAVDSGDLSLADAILARLNHPLAAPTGHPIQRAAFYFREALWSLLPTVRDGRPVVLPAAAEEPLLSSAEIVRKIAAHQVLSALSPVPQFASFTANQTVLEALSGSLSIHLIDFEIGLGGQWSSFLHEVATRAAPPPPSVRITAVVPEESLETALAAANLRDFARGLGLRFAIDFVSVSSSGAMALSAVRPSGGESVAVSFTPATFRLLGDSPESVAGLLRFIRRTSPRVAVFVDAESGCCLPTTSAARSGPPSFRRAFAAGLEYYSAVLESLDAAAAAIGCGGDEVRRVERWVIRPRVSASLAASLWARELPWMEMFEAAGMTSVPFSEFTESQAECLIKRTRVEGFHVGRREGSLVLTWHGMELVATSAWKF